MIMVAPHFPPEILAHIFDFACTDDGSTYRALSLVSHNSRALVAPYRFQSLVLSSPEQIQRVASELRKWNGTGHTSAPRYLFVSDTSTLTSHPYDLGKTDLAYILSIAAPTLSSLVIDASHSVFSSTSLFAHLFSLHLPQLLDLEILGFYPYPHAHTTTSSPMPNLTRLSLTGNRNPVGLLQRGNLDAACPSLRTLHLRGLAQAVPFALELQQAADCCIRSRTLGSHKVLGKRGSGRRERRRTG